MEKKKIVDKCIIQQSILTGEDLGEAFDANNLVVFCFEDSNVYECYTYEELSRWFNSQKQLTYWKIGLPHSRVYKLYYTGRLVDEVVNTMVNERYFTLFLYQKEIPGIGSYIGPASENIKIGDPIYTCIPITREALDKLDVIRAFVKAFTKPPK